MQHDAMKLQLIREGLTRLTTSGRECVIYLKWTEFLNLFSLLCLALAHPTYTGKPREAVAESMLGWLDYINAFEPTLAALLREELTDVLHNRCKATVRTTEDIEQLKQS